MADTTDNEFLDEQQVCAVLKIARSTIQQWRQRGEGPPYVKLGFRVRYRRADLDAWLAARTVRPESTP